MLKNEVENILNTGIKSVSGVGGGSIADSFIITCDNDVKYFVKEYNYKTGITTAEKAGLTEIAKSGAVKVPEVIFCDSKTLILEYIEQGTKSGNFWQDFAKRFAEMHKFTNQLYGYTSDNFIGDNPQKNKQNENWPEFYFENRLKLQFDMIEQNGYSDNNLLSLFRKLEDRIDVIIGNHETVPSLIHGDLWSGNFLCDNNGSVVLIDPAVYYADREADLAMTKLFGGFSPEFYKHYNEVYPLEEGWEFREMIYKLYHVMNHLNLFGRSYYPQVVSLLKSLIR